MIKALRGAAIGLSLLLVLQGCSGLPANRDGAAVSPVRQSHLERSGRFALSVTHSSNQQEAVQGGFSWQEANGRLQLDLRSPMGSTLARVYAEPTRAVLEYSDGRQEVAASPDALVELVLGSPVPVSGLRDWMQGITDDAVAVSAQRYDEQGRLSQFEQAGWRVSLQRYDELGPKLLQLNRHEASRSISVRLVIDN